MPHTFTFAEVVGLIGGIISCFVVVIGFLIRRSVFYEIDILKKDKQNRNYCEKQIEACTKDFSKVCKTVDEIRGDMKVYAQEFRLLNQKVDRIIGFINYKLNEQDKIR